MNEYIKNVVKSVKKVVENGKLERVAFVVLNQENVPLERFVFEIEVQKKNNVEEG